MSKDVPTRERSVRERGTFANHGDDPTLASYLSSLFLLLSVPSFILLAYGGHWYGLYEYDTILLVFGGLLVGSIALTFTIMHVVTR
ncbi:hypothetical protein SAMN05421858_1182 [Haladaptatus litoreus]|uniref:Uncharacterized protein n=1 Tax=Haladaptatus litoreus TaxID=553468 RepID=A0A1N6XLT9_9EURY|nr:hypothetical protein [Haladaptatus litoreus]SIR03189.1 hypothetical protein SAMN05421858_1182 [Haladaptatus litoreus]